ncbi:MAG: TraR/DksA family transcriptional regulator [Rhodospirillaceae bacterium]
MDQVQQLLADRLADALAAHRQRTEAPPNLTGICADCGVPIEPERLDALPTARRCIDCQAKHERAHRWA